MNRLKVAAAKGAVARPASSEVITSISGGTVHPGSRAVSQRCDGANPAISAIVAAKDSWNPGSVRLSGSTSSKTSADSATDRKLSARRSSSTAPSMTDTIRKARVVATLAPDSSR